MRHLTQVYDEPFNFEMVLREYGKFAGRKSTFQSFTRPVVMKAYENLQVSPARACQVLFDLRNCVSTCAG